MSSRDEARTPVKKVTLFRNHQANLPPRSFAVAITTNHGVQSCKSSHRLNPTHASDPVQLRPLASRAQRLSTTWGPARMRSLRPLQQALPTSRCLHERQPLRAQHAESPAAAFTEAKTPQTLTEKIVQRYAVGLPPGKLVRSGDYISLAPAVVMTHDNSFPVATKFMSMGATKIHNPDQLVRWTLFLAGCFEIAHRLLCMCGRVAGPC